MTVFDDLHLALPLNLAQASLGADVAVPTIDGKHVDLEIPAGTQHGALFKVRKAGVPHLRGRGRGDLIVDVSVRVPRKLTAQQRSLIEQLSQTLESAGEHDEDGILARIKGAFTAS